MLARKVEYLNSNIVAWKDVIDAITMESLLADVGLNAEIKGKK